jgi:hypothetical protein
MDKLTWFKSSYSSYNGQCVECARTEDGGMAVRDSKHPATSPLSFPRETWQAFLAIAKRSVVL